MERFWAKVSKTDGCWEWMGSRNNRGYGQLGLNGKLVLAHRFSMGMPAGALVLHRCDNPPCVRPSHLFLGSHVDNMADMKSKGRRTWRGMPGESHPMAKLSGAQVMEIRELLDWGFSQRVIGEAYGVSREAVKDIKSGRNWR